MLVAAPPGWLDKSGEGTALPPAHKLPESRKYAILSAWHNTEYSIGRWMGEKKGCIRRKTCLQSPGWQRLDLTGRILEDPEAQQGGAV